MQLAEECHRSSVLVCPIILWKCGTSVLKCLLGYLCQFDNEYARIVTRVLIPLDILMYILVKLHTAVFTYPYLEKCLL